jgi:hypothetical protein
MREPQTKEFAGHSYTVTPLPFMRAVRGYPLAARAVASGFMSLTPEEMQKVTSDLLSLVTRDGKEVLTKTSDLELAGDVNVFLSEVLPFSFDVNYGKNGDFSDAAPDANGAAESHSKGSTT